MNKNTLTNKKILIPIIIFSILSFIMIITAIIINQRNKELIKEDTIDPASGKLISKPTGGPIIEGSSNYVGFEKFIAEGANFNKFQEFKKTIQLYNSKNYKKNKPIERVSLYKDSYKIKSDNNSSLIEKLKIELDINQKTLWVKIITSSPFRYKFELFNDEKMTNKAFERNFCDPQVCTSK